MIEEQAFKPPGPLHTAVLFLIYKRPDTTQHVFEAIRCAKPPKLYVAADGPKADLPGETEKVRQTRNIVLKGVDWDCELKTLFRDTNLGCKYGVSEGIDWFFENEKEGIILEDDILPSQSFFWFCQELLERYRNDEQIFIISGYNKQNEWKPHLGDYFLSHFGGIWGWATWRRAWRHYDMQMSGIEYCAKSDFFEKSLGKKLGKMRKNQLLNAKYQNNIGKINSWAYPWAYARHKNDGLACVPAKSLIQNIGFCEDATHTKNNFEDVIVGHEIDFPLRECFFFIPDRDYDFLFIFSPPIYIRIFNKLKRMLSVAKRLT